MECRGLLLTHNILLSSVCRQLAMQQTWQLPVPTVCWAPHRAQGFSFPKSGCTVGLGGKHPEQGPAGGRDSAQALWRGTTTSHCTAPTQKHISQPQAGSCFTFCSNRHTGCAGNQAGLTRAERDPEPPALLPSTGSTSQRGPGALGQRRQSAPYLHCIRDAALCQLWGRAQGSQGRQRSTSCQPCLHTFCRLSIAYLLQSPPSLGRALVTATVMGGADASDTSTFPWWKGRADRLSR